MQLRNTTDQDIHLSADQLEQKYSPAGGGQHPTFTREDWRNAVVADDTTSGYWSWVNGQIQSLLDDSLLEPSASKVVEPSMDLVADEKGVRQLHFVATIHGSVDVNDGKPGSPSVTESELGRQISDSINTMIGNGGLTGDTPAVVDSKSVSICVAEVLHTSQQTISMLREQGYAVVLFNKDELGNASASALQNRLIELASDEIQYLQPAE
ncbi:hypothetical protein H2O04_22910 [Pseudomonas aeruginosa]|uniref:Uncharacterized protein n=3 Tax=Pseudomonas TaxID=286 RepID=A0A1V0M6G9_PSEAI|nr:MULTISPECIES: hypothetical protein [Pseudomonas]MCP8473033.1 hypothetical protein [Pseudomonas triclosanedens]MCP8479757.1 hypothetical protein [Pseudomonas triclosanedens]ANI18870.1 hypothetical protein A9C11_32980 [Pseudomonas citronellolis]ARD70451.1 Hypothetical protein [Pseudomonas aeruginosa]EIU1445675.1 hypothetical protein [Pseudomonas aeruginosa]